MRSTAVAYNTRSSETRHELVLPLEVEQHGPVTHVRSRRDRAERQGLEPLTRGHVVRGAQDVFAPRFFRNFSSPYHACSIRSS